MPLFTTTVIMLGQTAQGMGVYPRSYVTEAKTAAEAGQAASAAELKAHPSRLFYDMATERVPNAVVREAAKEGGIGTVHATGVVLSHQTEAGTAMRAFSHASAKGMSTAKDEAVAAAKKAHPDKTVVYADTIPTPPETVRAVAARLAERTTEVRASRTVPEAPVRSFDVREFSEKVVNKFRQTALDVGPEKARSATIYEVSREAGLSGTTSVNAAIKVAGGAIDSYVERRRDGVAHVEARSYAAGENARRFDGTGRDAMKRSVAVREQEMAL